MELRRAISLSLAAILAVSPVVPARADVKDLSASSQALLLLRVLAYDRKLKERVGSAVTVTILSRQGDKESEARTNALHKAFEQVSRDVVVAGLTVKSEVVPYRDQGRLDAAMELSRSAMVYADRALTSSVAEIAVVTRKRKVLSADGSKEMVEAGLAVGVVPRGSRAAIIINLPAAKKEGTELDPALLEIAEVLRE